MPIYEYQCKACGHQMEAFQKISEAALTDCPACHQRQLQKLISAAGFQLKGAGWYATDYRKKEAKEDKKDTAAGGTTTSATKEKKTDSGST